MQIKNNYSQHGNHSTHIKNDVIEIMLGCVEARNDVLPHPPTAYRHIAVWLAYRGALRCRPSAPSATATAASAESPCRRITVPLRLRAALSPALMVIMVHGWL